MDKFNMETKNMTQENIKKIGDLFPNVITEIKDENGNLKKGINFELLKQELSKDIVDHDEHFEFTWVGKMASIVEANTPIRKTLRPYKEESKNWETTENIYIEGDNLDALKLLQESYLGKVKMIYIDPPYNRGTDSFIYPDNFIMDEDVFDALTEIRNEDGNIQFRENSKANPRFHSDWCSMMYPRLKLAQNLLSEDGIIFISIDDNEIKNLKSICDEIFGEEKLVGIIHRRKNRKPHNAGNTMSLSYEFILAYYKSSSFKLAQEYAKMYQDEYGFYAIYPIIKSDKKERIYTFKAGILCEKDQLPAGIYKAKNANLNIEILDEGIVNNGRLQNDIRIKGRFCLTDENGKLSEAMKQGNIYINSNGFPKEKRYRTEEENKIDNHHWDIEKGKNEDGDDEIKEIFSLKGDNFLFSYPKPVALISKILSTIPENHDIILDFFSGSATTAHGVMKTNAVDKGNRKFIMIQLPELISEKTKNEAFNYMNFLNKPSNIAEIGKERIRRAGEKIKKEVEEENRRNYLVGEQKKVPDIGFRVFKVDSTNMKDVFYSANEYTQENLIGLESNIKEDRTDLDLLYGVLLEWGLPLSLPHETKKIEEVTFHIVDQNALIACFEEKVPETVIREIAKYQPLRVVFRDSSFASSPEKINIEEIFKLLSPNTTVKVL